MRNNYYGLVPGILLAGCLIGAPVEGADSYYDLYLLAKKNDSLTVRAEARLASVRSESRVVLSNLLPRLDATVGASQINQTVQNYESGTQTGSVLGYNYAVSARINALHIPTLMNLKAADASIRIEESGVRAARQELVVRFAQAYLGLLKAQQDFQITQKEFERVKQIHEQSQMFLKAGMGDIIAVYEAKARMDSVTADINRFEGNLRLAEQKLSTLVGKPVKDVQEYAPLAVMGAQPDNLAWWLDTMEKQDPFIRQGIDGVDRTSREVKAVKSEHLPTIQASGGYTSSKGSVFLPEVETRQWYIGATVSIPIYSGGETTAKVQRAVANEAVSKSSLDELRKQRSENLKDAYYNLVYNVALVKSLEQRLSSAELQLTAVKKGRSIGTRSAIDVLNAEQSYSVALKEYRNALYDNALKNILLKNAAGVLDDDNQVPMLPQRQVEPVKPSTPAPAVVPAVAAAQVQEQVAGSGVGVLLLSGAKTGAPLLYADADKKQKFTGSCTVVKVPTDKTVAPAKGSSDLPSVVLDTQKNMVKLACAQGGTAWVELRLDWQYLPWKEYFKGKKVQMLSGLMREQYAIYDAEEKQVLETVTPKDILEVENVIEHWLLVKSGKVQFGWLRWKDAKGALLVSVVK